MPTVVTSITAADIPGAVRSIQDAFDADPFNNWVFDKSNFNVARNFASLKAKCEWGVASSSALFYVAKDSDDPSGKVIGVSMWTTPAAMAQGGKQSWADWYNDYLLWFKQGVNVLWYQGWGGLKRDRYWVWKREQAKVQEEVLVDPSGYYFVNIVTVNPEAQGKGVGKMLFEVVTKLADKEGRKCYLESSRWEPNVAIYRKMGFEVVKEMKCVAEDGSGEACDLFCMVREPQAKK